MKKSKVHYDGIVDDEIRSQLQDFLQSVATSNKLTAAGLKRILCFALELLDNAQRYAIGQVSFDWSSDDSQLIITLRNEAKSADANRLKTIVDRIKTMSAEEIDKEYKEQLINGQFGAGLGYLQMARKGAKDMEIELLDSPNGYNLCISKIATNL
jgi:Family of unknown function (DUF6272)